MNDTTAVGSYSPREDSPYGCADMAGNVWEWTHSRRWDYPYRVDDGREAENLYNPHILRGGSCHDHMREQRCACRGDHIFLNLTHNRGFRLVIAPKLPG